MTMKFMYHGAWCCGIKTIYGFSQRPDQNVSALEAETSPAKVMHWASVGEKYYRESRPKETALERLDFYLDWDKGKRPYGITEIVLTDGNSYDVAADNYEEQYGKNSPLVAMYREYALVHSQIAHWDAALRERGFKVVSKCFNSNSNNNLYIYHLCRKKRAAPKKKEAAA